MRGVLWAQAGIQSLSSYCPKDAVSSSPTSSRIIPVGAASSFTTGKRCSYLIPNSRPFGGSVVVEIGANKQSCEPPTTLLFKLVLEVVLGGVGSLNGMGNTHRERSNPLKSAD